MKIAALGDIHANLPALEAVLADIQRREISELWILGDLVGYNAFPNEVVDSVREHASQTVAGNYDQKVLAFPEKRDRWEKTKKSEKFYAFRWAFEKLTEENRDYLNSLPEEIRLNVEGKTILLAHGSPDVDTEPLTEETPKERLAEIAAQTDADVLVCAHSHVPFIRKVKKLHFINTGSVGLPIDGDPRACYVVLNFFDNKMRATHHRVGYDVQKAAETILAKGLPKRFAEMVVAGKPWKEIDSTDMVTEELSPKHHLIDRRDEHLTAVQELVESCDYEVDHTHHVTYLAMLLFDKLADLHGYGEEERFLLECAAMLHDIGWIDGRTGHHKASLRRILNSSILQFGFTERCIIGLITRYHRRALPSDKHQHYAVLTPSEQELVSTLSAILRVADGLDRTHRSLIRNITATFTKKVIRLRCEAEWPAEMERQQALEKGLLLEQVFGRRLEIEWYLA